MPKRPIDRGDALRGQNKTTRDSRSPSTLPRSIQNFSLPDGKLRRRLGYKSLNEPVVSQALCKATGTGFTKRLIESQHGKGTVRRMPLSYGLIRWNSEYQLRRSEAKTIEFSVKLGDAEESVINPFYRFANRASAWSNYSVRPAGVFIIDQTIISNYHQFNDGSLVSGASPTFGTYHGLVSHLAADQFDVFPLTAFSCQIANNLIVVNVGMLETTGGGAGTYWSGNSGIILTYDMTQYTPDSEYHVAVVNDPTLNSGNGALILYVNGVEEDRFDFHSSLATYEYIGESDLINGVAYASGLNRDIVLLNECTVRGSYSSACKIRGTMHGFQTLFHDYSTNPNGGIDVWCNTPPRGTAIWNLRYWDVARSEAQILANSNKRIDTDETNLVGNWHLNDGGPICEQKVSTIPERRCTIHHGYPGYINDSGFVNGNALLLADGQHLICRFGENDRFLGSGLAAQLDSVFEPFKSGGASYLNNRDQHSFTVQIQLKVPDQFQPELNDAAGAPATYQDLFLTENRRNMNTGASVYDGLQDGTAETSAASRAALAHPLTASVREQLRAYDQTIWSIEGTQLKNLTTTDTVTDEADRRRIPVAGAKITPAGKVAFELHKNKTNGTPYYFRLVSSNTLLPGKVYAITFIQRALFVFTAGSLNADGWRMEIHIKNITDDLATVITTYTVAAGSSFSTASINHAQNYDISIGASMVNDGYDHSINMPFPNGVVPITKTCFIPSPSSKRTDHGPWPVQQRFMSPYQDQPANIAVGMFRLWSVPLSGPEVEVTQSSSIPSKDHTADLLFNLEFKTKSGREIPNFSRYLNSFELGYKGWGMPQGYRNQLYLTINSSVYLKREQHEGSWANEDCLGYTPLLPSQNGPTQDTNQDFSRVNGIIPFKSSYGNQYGVLAVFDDAVVYDEAANDVFERMYVANHGLMSEFVPGLSWRGTIVGDRTILTSDLALPKVFNGKSIHPLGFKKWAGGQPISYETATISTPGLTLSKWYGVVIVYISEEYGTYQVSPVTVTYLASTKAIGIYMVPPHPDQRVTAIEVYRTLPQATYDLAKNAPLFKTRVGNNLTTTVGVAGANIFSESLVIDEPDSSLSGVILSRDTTEFPICGFTAALNERLFLAGDPNNPDAIYYTDPGNPERIDALFNNLLLPEGSGDAVSGMVSAFNAIYIFKPSAIWRLDDLGGNNFQFTKVSKIGPLNNKSIAVYENPDTGADIIFFWSHHGPYLFDGNNPNYIGYPIEESTSKSDSNPEYNWLNPSSVVVFHDAEAREIVCTYVPRRTDDAGVVTELDRNGEAVVYNYRFNAWTSITGTICTNALSVSISGNLSSVDINTNSITNDKYRIYVGGDNGKIYSWRDSKYDGLPIGVTAPVLLDVTRQTDYSYILTGLPSKELSGCWLTIYVPSTNNWVTVPIESNDQSLDLVVVSQAWLDSSGFDKSYLSSEVCKAYICQPACLVEFPWDELNSPYLDKDIIEMATWHNGALYYRYGHSYDTIRTAWKQIADCDSQRKRTQLKIKTDAIKLEFMSRDVDISFDSMVVFVKDMAGANTPNV